MKQNKSLQDRLRRYLIDSDMTQAEAAEKIDRTTRTVSRILAGLPVSARTAARVEKMIMGGVCK